MTDTTAAQQPLPDRRPEDQARHLAVAGAVIGNFVLVAGVLWLDWPPGNVFLLFWVENVIIGLSYVVRISSARGGDRGGVGTALFFTVHYGIFCLVHAAFTALLAIPMGIELSVWGLWVPTMLIALRYLVETVTAWFGSGRFRHRTPQETMMEPYPRVMVLHAALLLGFGASMVLAGRADPLSTDSPFDLAGRLPLLPLFVLVALKTVADVVTTRRSLRTR